MVGSLFFAAHILFAGSNIQEAFFSGECTSTNGWRVAATEEGKEVYIPFEGYYESKGGRVESPRFDLSKADEPNPMYRLSFAVKSKIDGYWWVDFFDSKGVLLPDVNSRIYASDAWRDYDVVVPANPSARSAVVAFVSKKGVIARDVKVERIGVGEAADWCDRLYATLPQIDQSVAKGCWDRLPKAADAIRKGRRLRIVMLGDSIVNDTWCGNVVALIRRGLPNRKIEFILSVRGSTGCWYYREEENFEEYVARYAPDLVLIGGISNRRTDQSAKEAEDGVMETVRRCKEIDAEVVLCTPPPSYEFRRDSTARPFDAKLMEDDSSAWYLGQGYIRRAAERSQVALWDLTTAPCNAIAQSGKPLNWFKRDAAHSDDRGKQLLARTLASYFCRVLER